MDARHRIRGLALVGVGLSILCAVPRSVPLPGRFIGSALADEEGWLGTVVPAKAGCAAAPRSSAEPVPELLALADWPLDRDGPCAVPREKLPPPVEVRVPAVKTVYAAGFDGADAMPLPGGSIAPPAGDKPVSPPGSRVAPKRPLQQLAALDPAALDNIRGGFEPADTNLKFSFGFERVVYINGNLVASTVLSLKDLQLTSGGSATPSALPPGMANAPAVIQNGAGNSFSVQAGQNVAGTVIQNSLNNQQIDTVTTISAVVNSAQVLRTINLQSTIRDTVINSLRR